MGGKAIPGGVLDWQGIVQKHGYGLIPNVFARNEVLDLLDDLPRENLPRTPAGVRQAMRSQGHAHRLRQSNAGDRTSILGTDAMAFRATLFEKLPDSNWLVAWHQDTALPLRERRDVPGWGPWSVKDGVAYAHAPAHVLGGGLALR